MGNARVLRQLQRGLRRTPDPEAMRRAVREFLAASGLDPSHPDLRDTPARVAEAWVEHFLDGYGKDPAQVLADRLPAPEGSRGEVVVVTGLRFHSMCPHHLLPTEGTAHLAYVPGKWVIGFGRLAALLDTWAHRLILQEELARGVARSLQEHLGAAGSACIVEAHQACLRVRGEEQRDAVTHAEAYEGVLRKDGLHRRELWARIAAADRAREEC